MTGKLPSFFKETIGVMLNLCLTVYIMYQIFGKPEELKCFKTPWYRAPGDQDEPNNPHLKNWTTLESECLKML